MTEISMARRDPKQSPQPDQERERRSHQRFPLRLTASYWSTAFPTGLKPRTTEVLNISSGGLLLAGCDGLVPGQRVQVSVDWPVLLNGRIPLFLVLEGRILRCENGTAAMLIRRHQFDTRRGW